MGRVQDEPTSARLLNVTDAPLLAESWQLALRADRKSPQTVKPYGEGVRQSLTWCEAHDAAPFVRPSLRDWVAGWLAGEGELGARPTRTPAAWARCSGNESLIGAALAQVSGEFVVATKAAPGALHTGGGSGFRRDQIHATSRRSLRRLGREHLDIYFLHWPDDTGVPLQETWGAMSELVDDGLVRAIGVSNYGQGDIELCHAQRTVDVVQTGLSMIDYLEDRNLISNCGELGTGVVIYEPLAGGIMTGKTLEQVKASWAGWEEAGFYKRLLAPGKAERSLAVMDAARPIGRSRPRRDSKYS